ncbi:TPA: phage tail assembly protein T [Enterobacter cloacae]|uniref:Phage tail assembly protein n=2 Tax=Enterobacteriaceae TaxID=543 RepID=A0A0F1A6R3_9ENTR|nr:phage tail assembly protein [Enterobacter sichuanensis]HBN5338379.1 phage tail protein [Enterobacter cloacae]
MGGRTIAEAQEFISIREYQVWAAYRSKYGSLNPMMRTEWAAGLVASVLANINRGKDTPPFTITDFTPHINAPAITLEEAMKEWT